MVKSKKNRPKRIKRTNSKKSKIMYGGADIREKGLAVDIRDILKLLKDRGNSIPIDPRLTFPPDNIKAEGGRKKRRKKEEREKKEKEKKSAEQSSEAETTVSIEEKQKEAIRHDNQIQAAINMINLLTLAKKAQPKSVATRKNALAFLKQHFITDETSDLVKIDEK